MEITEPSPAAIFSPSDFQAEIIALNFEEFVEQTNIKEIAEKEVLRQSEITKKPVTAANIDARIKLYYEKRHRIQEWWPCGLKHLKFKLCECKRNRKFVSVGVQTDVSVQHDAGTQCTRGLELCAPSVQRSAEYIDCTPPLQRSSELLVVFEDENACLSHAQMTDATIQTDVHSHRSVAVQCEHALEMCVSVVQSAIDLAPPPKRSTHNQLTQTNLLDERASSAEVFEPMDANDCIHENEESQENVIRSEGSIAEQPVDGNLAINRNWLKMERRMRDIMHGGKFKSNSSTKLFYCFDCP